MDDASPRKDSSRAGLLPGQVIKGRYRVIARRGAGRLATVYLGEEVTTAKKVALKVFHRELAKDEEILERLRQQAKLAAVLSENHPRIVTVNECDRAEDGSVFIVMECLDGRSLKDVIRQEGPLDIERALRLAGQIAEGLEAGHAMGLVHTDLRPQNVLVQREGEEETIKLKGFEVVGLRETRLLDHLIRAGVVTGNPEYAAPEQIEGAQLTPRTDVYSFGVLLYEMLTGDVPFRGSCPDGVLARHLQETPPALKNVRPEVPWVVELKVRQALEKEPERRQRHAIDVINESLYEYAIDELLLERDRRRYGPLWKVMATAQAWLAGAREIATDPERVGARWMVLGATVWLLLVSASAVWVLSTRQIPTRSAPAPIQRPLSGSGTRAPADRGGSGEQRMDPSALPLPRQPSTRPQEAKSSPQKTVRRPDRTVPATTRRKAVDLTEIARVPSKPRQEAAMADTESPDPTAIIDWLLEQSPAKNR